MKTGVIQFPGSCDDHDAVLAARRFGGARLVWHAECDLSGLDLVVLPGGFSYGDYLRPGVMAQKAPVMTAIAEFAAAGGLVMGICNGFQILCEAGLLPGVLRLNRPPRFVCKQARIRVESTATPFTSEAAAGDLLSLPLKHSAGAYYAADEQIAELEQNDQIVLRYVADEFDNGSVSGIAGIVNDQRNVLGLMPHPEHAVNRLLGSEDGCIFFRSAARTFVTADVAQIAA